MRDNCVMPTRSQKSKAIVSIKMCHSLSALMVVFWLEGECTTSTVRTRNTSAVWWTRENCKESHDLTNR